MSELKELMLRPPALTLAVAESVTAGHVQARVAAVSGASEFFLGGLTAYTLEQKVRQLGVARAAAKRVNCVSAEVAKQMALGICTLFGSELGLATTGYAEPAPKLNVSAPFAWWSLVHLRRGRAWRVLSGRVECPGVSRTEAQAMMAEAALAELTAYLRGLRG